MPDQAAAGLLVCNACGRKAPPGDMIPDLTMMWAPTGHVVCRDPDACYERFKTYDGPTHPDCGPACWTPAECPKCGTSLPPRGRALPPGTAYSPCCRYAAGDAGTNPRHLWDEKEAR